MIIRSWLRPSIIVSSKLFSGLTPMNELPRVQPFLEHIQQFVSKTNDGRVFTLDTSTLDTTQSSVCKELSPEEIQERKEWEKTRSELEKRYLASRIWEYLTPSELLLCRVAPPVLDDRITLAQCNTRSGVDTKRQRSCPDKVYVWEDFENGARSFTVPAAVENVLRLDGHDPIYHSLHDKGKIVYAGEGAYVFHQVLVTLRAAGLLKHGPYGDAVFLLKPTPVLGKASHFLFVGGNKTVPIEFKATHNLLLPEKADEVVRRYSKAREEVTETQECTADWINIGHPLAQIINYMFVARSRYGVLSSGTRTYFFKVEEADDGPRVFITDAWFIGQPDFLRAWAYLYQLATGNGDIQVPPGLEKKWQTWTRGVGRKDPEGRDDGERPSTSLKSDNRDSGPGSLPRERFMTWLDPGVAPSIPRVDSDDIEFVGGLLGHGTNGVFLALWKGETVAVKVFDVYKALSCFENEIRAYEHLKDAWGVLVPEPYFIADRFGLVLLGMQLGHIPIRKDSEFYNEREILFRTLQRDYGFAHSDDARYQDHGNVIFLPDKGGTGPGRVVAIDLEAHQIRQEDDS